MNAIPHWLHDRLSKAATAREATRELLFHGTIEPFEGGLRASNWERLRWFAESPEVAQSYCAQSGTEASIHFTSYSLDERFVPHQCIQEAVFSAMGFDAAAMEATRNRYGRMDSYRLLPNHPTNRQAREYLEALGYVFENECTWLKMRMRPGMTDEIMPNAWRTPGRLFVAERPADLRLYDLQSSEDGGLTGRQWMRTDMFERLAQSGEWDGIIIDDVNQSGKLGHFSHRSIGLFQPAMSRLRMHVIACVHCDPYDVWYATGDSTTPEFDELYRAAATHLPRLAA